MVITRIICCVSDNQWVTRWCLSARLVKYPNILKFCVRFEEERRGGGCGYHDAFHVDVEVSTKVRRGKTVQQERHKIAKVHRHGIRHRLIVFHTLNYNTNNIFKLVIPLLQSVKVPRGLGVFGSRWGSKKDVGCEYLWAIKWRADMYPLAPSPLPALFIFDSSIAITPDKLCNTHRSSSTCIHIC